MLSNKEKNIVLFDMDNTLVTADTMELWGYFLEEKAIAKTPEKEMRLKLKQDYLDRKLDITENFGFEISLIKSIPEQEREIWRDEFFHQFVKSKISIDGLGLIQAYKKNPDTVIILITASLSFIASPVAKYAGVDDLIATEAEIKNGVYTGRISGIASLGEGKLERFKLWLQEKNIIPAYSMLYSDSINDLPLLDFVNKPIIVDPDEMLAMIAREKNWECISLKNPLSLSEK